MPNCYSLTRKSAPEAGAVSRQLIDEEMCAHFGVTTDPIKWYYDWDNIIGFRLAFGNTLAQQIAEAPTADMRDEWQQRLLEIMQWLDANFEANAWAEVGRR